MAELKFKSFATRLSVYTIVFTIIIFTVIVVLFYTYSRERMIKHAVLHTHSLLENMATQIENRLNSAEDAVENCEWIVKENLTKPDSLYRIVTSLVENNDVIAGSSIAFEPDYFPEKGKYFMVYAYKDNDRVKHKILGGTEYNYFYMDWYQIPKLLGKSYWSEPYYDQGGGDMMMTTFSYPLFDKHGKLFAVFTADVSLEHFTTLVEHLEPYKSSYSVLLSRYGYYLTHYKKEKIMNETIFSETLEAGNAEMDSVARDIISGHNGTIRFDKDGEDSFIFYRSVPNIGWSLCNICPADVILGDLFLTSRNIIILFIIGAVLLFVSTFNVIKKLTQPLENFTDSVRQISTGDFKFKLPVIKSHDEMRTLYDSFAHMQVSLEKYMGELKETTQKKERIESELNIARKIQMGMLPVLSEEIINGKGISLYAVLQPAKEVGGDLYNYYIDNNKLYFIIGDVSGKGVPASLLMAITSSLFRMLVPRGHSPREIMGDLNRMACESNSSNIFTTLIVGVLDTGNGELTLCNAGHNKPLLLGSSENISVISVEQNIPIGIFEDYEYKEETMHIDRETTIFLYTDGVTEAENEDKLLYGEKRLIEILEKNINRSPQDLINIVLSSLAGYKNGSEANDDLTMLVINYKNSMQND